MAGSAEQVAGSERVPERWFHVARSPRFGAVIAALFLVAGVGRLVHAIVVGGDVWAWAGSTFFTAGGLFYTMCTVLMVRSTRRT